jgi:GTPase
LGFLTISLAGYTNAGKSSLFNALTIDTAKVEVDNALFTTLSTTTRMIEFSNRKFLLTDTVGFIDRLPIALIEAFHSTLEETIFSDLIIVVLDLSEPIETIEKKNNVCLETIDRLGASDIKTVTALNKIDLISVEERNQKLEALKDKVKNPILLSAKRQTNLDELRRHILRVLENYVQAQFTVPLTGNCMPFISWVHQKAHIEKENFTNDSVEVSFESSSSIAEQIKRKVEDLNGKFQAIKPQ